MPQSLEERVAYLKGRVSDQAQARSKLREMMLQLCRRVDHLDQKVDRLRDELSARITGLEESVNARITGLGQSVNARFQSVNDRLDATNTRIDALDDKVSRQFVWLVGIQITVLVAVVSALVAALLQ